MKAKHMIVAAGVLAALGARAADTVHFELRSSAPRADATGPSPSEVRLWFTAPPEENSVGIRLIDPTGTAVQTTAPTRDKDDSRVYSVAVRSTLPDGRYTVSWRGLGDDSHALQGNYMFAVASE